MKTVNQQDISALRSIGNLEISKSLSLNKSDLFWLSILCITSVLIRVIYIFVSGIPSQAGGDAEGYIELAQNVAAGRGFTRDGVLPYTHRPPLFSSLLGAWCYLLGSTSLTTMVAFQILAQSLTAPLTYVLVRSIPARKSLAIAGGFFIAAYPFIFSNVGYIIQEPMQMLLATATAIAIVIWYQSPNISHAIAVGLLFGFGALAKAPNLIAPFIPCFVWLLSREFRCRIPLQQLLLLLAVTIIVVSPWTFRNFLVTDGKFIAVNSQTTGSLLWIVADAKFRIRKSLSDLPIMNSKEEGIAFSYGNNDGINYLNTINADLLERGESISTIEEMIKVASIYYLLNNPSYTFKILTRGIVLLMSPHTEKLFANSLSVRILLMILFHLPLFMGLILGISFAIIQKNSAFIIISLFTIGYLLFHIPLASSGGRYTVPMIPLLIAATIYGIEQLIVERKSIQLRI